MDWQQYLIIASFVWLGLLTGGFIWLFLKLNSFFKESEEKSLIKVLERTAKQEKENKEDITKLFKHIDRIDDEALANVKKVGLERFNPFNETGGDHSFSLALLDGKDNGIVLTGLHTRERTRLYIKPIKKSKSEYELSKEEQKAIEKASK